MRWPNVPSLLFVAYLLVLMPWAAWRTARRLKGIGDARPVSRMLYWRSAVATQAVLLLLSGAVGSTFDYAIFAYPSPRWDDLGYGAGALAACFALRAAVKATRSEDEQRSLQVYKRSPRTRAEGAWFVAAALLAGVAEEAAYRGVGWQTLGYMLGNVWLAAALLGIAFALAHWNQGSRSMLVIAAYAALFYGLVLVTRTLVVAMVVHAIYDLIAGYLIHRQALKYDMLKPSQGAP